MVFRTNDCRTNDIVLNIQVQLCSTQTTVKYSFTIHNIQVQLYKVHTYSFAVHGAQVPFFSTQQSGTVNKTIKYSFAVHNIQVQFCSTQHKKKRDGQVFLKRFV